MMQSSYQSILDGMTKKIIKYIVIPDLIAVFATYLSYIIQILHYAHENNIKFPWQQ